MRDGLVLPAGGVAVPGVRANGKGGEEEHGRIVGVAPLFVHDFQLQNNKCAFVWPGPVSETP
jgi:hypothetical protein